VSARVVIAGGGVAALEAAIALHETAGDRAEVAMYSPREDFIYRPFAVVEPYGASRPMRYDLSELAAPPTIARRSLRPTVSPGGSTRTTARRSLTTI
jgi:sulfide:quinone oxidoreductase